MHIFEGTSKLKNNIFFLCTVFMPVIEMRRKRALRSRLNEATEYQLFKKKFSIFAILITICTAYKKLKKYFLSNLKFNFQFMIVQLAYFQSLHMK